MKIISNTNKINKAKIHITNIELPRVVCSAGCRQTLGSLGLDSAADRNRTRECMDGNPDQDCRQDKEQGPLQKPAMDEGSETLMMPQL